MQISETLKLANRQRITIDAAALEQINAANKTASFDDPSQVFAVEAVIIDSEPTRNRNEYPAEWQEAMRGKWIGVPLVYSEQDHAPNAPDHVGWIYATSIEQEGGKTATIARFAIPIIADTERLVQRFRAGLNHSVSIAVETAADGIEQTEEGIRRLVGDSTPIHVALVGDPGSRGAGIRATSEARLRIEEKLQHLDEVTQILIDDGRRIREPVIQEAVKFSRLNDVTANPTQIRERLERWALADIEAYRDLQRSRFQNQNPNASKQLAHGGDSEEPQIAPRQWKTLEQITKANRPE